jgi:hypothetical protein
MQASITRAIAIEHPASGFMGLTCPLSIPVSRPIRPMLQELPMAGEDPPTVGARRRLGQPVSPPGFPRFESLALRRSPQRVVGPPRQILRCGRRAGACCGDPPAAFLDRTSGLWTRTRATQRDCTSSTPDDCPVERVGVARREFRQGVRHRRCTVIPWRTFQAIRPRFAKVACASRET